MDDAADTAFEARDRVLEGLASGESREETEKALIRLGLGESQAVRFYDQIRDTWHLRRKVADLVASGRRHMWIGAIGLGAGLSLVAGVVKASNKLRSGVPERMWLLPWLLVAISVFVMGRGLRRFWQARRMIER